MKFMGELADENVQAQFGRKRGLGGRAQGSNVWPWNVRVAQASGLLFRASRPERTRVTALSDVPRNSSPATLDASRAQRLPFLVPFPKRRVLSGEDAGQGRPEACATRLRETSRPTALMEVGSALNRKRHVVLAWGIPLPHDSSIEAIL